ncbi:TonB-dependent siderophore receptor [Flavobacterium psychrotolerans]|uniref:TonB-dependent siderophore receptor n=1 Tax=Flavobacterium psychrotolerans TaxID=2169410 RepID=A0A2U1JQM7_9FLAO|nr:TonB-dependent receptor [Flavobacterium psychrotolerans]PWA07461.1 TonB-dependent siderophore receptor [Flavobacterium psychrotolerans]
MKHILLLIVSILFCLSGFAQETASISEKTNNNETYYTVLDTVKNKKGEVLQEVIINAKQQKNPVFVGKSGIKPMDLPQSVSVINQATLQNQQIVSLTDVLKNTNGVYIMGNTGGYQEEIASRGYSLGSSNTFKNGVRYFNGMPTEMSGIEKVEFLKGSAAILFGNVTAGGVLNLITKKPKFNSGADVSIGIGSFDLYKTTFDVYGGLGDSKKVAFRMNGSNTQANSFRKGVSSETKYINPSFLINFTEKTSLLVEADYIKDERTPDFGAGIINYELVDLPRERFTGISWGYNKAEQASQTTTLKHQLSDNWDLSFVNSFRYYKTDLFANARPNTVLGTPANSAPILSVDADGNWKRSVQRSEAKDNYWLQELNLKGKFKTWDLNHQVLIGVDTDENKTVTLAYKNMNYDTINIFTTDLSSARFDIPMMAKNTLITPSIKRVGGFVQDLISFNKYLKVLAGVRYSYQDTENNKITYTTAPITTAAPVPTVTGEKTDPVTNQYDSAFSPRFGLIFQPNEHHSLFASYSNSFVPNTGIDYATGKAMEPSTIKQYEAGLKNELFKERLFANLTLYQIENDNLAQQSLANGNADVNIKEMSGATKSKGVEIDLVANPVKGLSLLAGYSFTEIKYTSSNTYIVGSSILYMPKNTANLNFNYIFNDGKLKGLNLGLINSYVGARAAGRSTQIRSIYDPRKPVALPDYFQSDATISYKFHQLTFRGKISNIFDTLSYNVHDDNSVNPIAPRNYALTINYNF